MCGRYTLTYPDLGEVVAALDALLDPAAVELYRPRYNIAPTSTCVIARGPQRVAERDRPALVPASWGLTRDRRLITNARAENAPARFKAAYQHGRCVVPADGFYEWTGPKNDRRPIWFHAGEGNGPLLMAGLVEDRGEGLPAFTVLTTGARPPVREIHDRMPVLLSRESARTWLLGEPPGAIRPDEVPLAGRPVSQRVNSAAHDDPACLDPPVEPAKKTGKQLALF
jgi:putative SOS response-associated peptidase YedK